MRVKPLRGNTSSSDGSRSAAAVRSTAARTVSFNSRNTRALSLYASTTADFFGTKNVGANYGLVFLAFGVAGIVGPKLGGRIFDQFQSYTRAFDIAAILLVIAFAIIVTLKAPQKQMAGKAVAART